MLVLGKTAVLVERIINKIINDKIDVDKLLVVTFTKAAASEMKERLAVRMYKELDNHPELLQQIRLLSKSYITTIDSFCLRVVKDNFFKCDLDPNFKIGENGETELLKLEALEECLEEKYLSDDEDYINLFNAYTSNKNDDLIRELILKIYNYIMSFPEPFKWVDEKISLYNIDNSITDAKETIYGKSVLDNAIKIVTNSYNELEHLYNDIKDNELAGKYIEVVYEDICNLRVLSTKNNSWNDFYEAINNFSFVSAQGAKGVPKELKDKISEVRQSVKDVILKDVLEKYFSSNSQEILEDLHMIYKNLLTLKDLLISFRDKYFEKKFENNVFEFNDISHFCLEILINNKEIVDNYREKFSEILIDEYQDSNYVQESILSSISKNNIFMVGDVKQSIYRFRQARPELFLNKYVTYKSLEDCENDDTPKKVLLYKNFRSKKNIVKQINYIFENIMSKEVGEIEYGENEYLKFGAEFYTDDGERPELVFIESKNHNDDLEINEDMLYDTKHNLEGKFIANKIKSLVGKIDIFDKKIDKIRKAEYKDFVILLRSTIGKAEAFINELSMKGIPAYAENGGDYFEHIEVQTILSVLRIIDNPYQDIPLIAVLKSPIGNFSVDELSTIRLTDRSSLFYDALFKSLNLENELSNKVKHFIDMLSSWREKVKHISLWNLIWQIYMETGYFYYVSLFPDGTRRRNNLKLLLERAEMFEKSSFKGVFNFLRYIDNLKATSADFSESKTIGENENVVRIMSIHKSKGLEFPIVFLAGSDRNFYTRDLQDSIILDQDLGFGMDVINYDLRAKYPCISKHATSFKIQNDNLSEEMRVLYVALTRAREKLIITGLVDDIDKSIESYSKKISPFKIRYAKSFLDWIAYSIVNKNNDWDVVKVKYDELYSQENESDSKSLSFQDVLKIVKGIDTSSDEEYMLIDSQMNWKYPNEYATKLPNKVSISELKRLKIIIDDESLDYNNAFNKKEIAKLVSKPEFMNEDVESGSAYGTLLHETLRRIDFKSFSIDDAKKIVSTFTDNQSIIKSIVNKISYFSKTNLFKEIADSNSIYKETSFNLNLSAREVYGIDSDEVVMIQGIIDLFFINQYDNIVLVDYKSDYVNSEKELIDRYKIQLDLYKKALEDILEKEVSKTIIYSFKLGKEIYL